MKKEQKKLSTKHKMFAKNLIKTHGHQTKAYQLTYPNASKITAEKNSCKILSEKPEIKSYMVSVMEKKGMDINSLVGKLKRLTNAKKEVLTSTGVVKKLVDNNIRLSATTTALKLHGHLQPSVHVGDDNRQVSININNKPTEDINKLVDKLTELNKTLSLNDDGEQIGEIVDADFSATDDTMDDINTD